MFYMLKVKIRMKNGMIIQNDTYTVVADSEYEAIEKAKKSEARDGHAIVEVISIRKT